MAVIKKEDFLKKDNVFEIGNKIIVFQSSSYINKNGFANINVIYQYSKGMLDRGVFQEQKIKVENNQIEFDHTDKRDTTENLIKDTQDFILENKSIIFECMKKLENLIISKTA